MNRRQSVFRSWRGVVLLLALLLGLSLGLNTDPVLANGCDINVPEHQATIQAAVNAATAGQTICVAAGTYSEAPVTINQAVTIKGANADKAGSALDRVAETQLLNTKLTITAAGVVIDGVEIYQTDNTADAILIQAAATVKNSVVKRYGVSTGTVARGITTAVGTAGFSVTDNLFTGDTSGGLFGGHKTWNSGLWINGGSGSVTGNVFENSRTAINADDFNVGITISGNTFRNSGTFLAFGGTTATDGQYTIADNEFFIDWLNPTTSLPSALFNNSNVAATFRINAIENTFGTVATTDLTNAEKFAIEARMYHRGRSSRNGVIDYVANQQIVAPGTTIQSAINAAASGDTVLVAPGTHTGNVALNKRVSIVGSGSGTDGSVLTNSAGGDSKVGVIQISASGLSSVEPIQLKDLRIQPSALAGISVGRFTESTATNVSYLALDNVSVVGTNTNPCTEQERGFYVDLTSSVEYLVIQNSAFTNLTYGWYFQKAVSADTSNVRYVTVENTVISNNNSKGIYAEKLADATFTNLTVSGNGFGPAASMTACSYFVPWLSGIDLNLKAGNYQNLSFVNPTVTNNGLGGAREGVGIAIKARDDSPSYNTFPASLNNVQILGGTITGNERGIRLGEPGKSNMGPINVLVNFANLNGNVKTYSGSDGSAYGALVNLSQSSVNAENNFWGVTTQAAIGILVSGTVDFDPWLGQTPVVSNVSNGDEVSGPVVGFSATYAGTGNPLVILSQFVGNPSGSAFNTGGDFFDINVSGSGPGDSLAISLPAGGNNGSLYYYNGANWLQVAALSGSPAVLGAVTPVGGSYNFTLNNTNTVPLLSQLTGTPFAGSLIPQIRITPSTTTIAARETFQVVVDAASPALFGVDVSMTFDAVELEVTNVALGNGLSAGTIAKNEYNNGTGTLRFAYSQLGATADNVSGVNLTLATITFSAKAAGATSVTLGSALFTDKNGNPATPDFLDSPINLTINPSPSVYADVALQGRADHAGMQLELKPTSTGNILYDSTVTTGRLEIANVPAGPYTARVSAPKYLAAIQDFTLPANVVSYDLTGVLTLRGGDINGDDQINIQDLVLIGVSFGSTTVLTADINGDNVVNIQDLAIAAGNYGLKTVPASGNTYPAPWQ